MKKKFTMLFAALLACVGVAKADVTDLPQITTDLENPIYYTIYNTRSSQPGGLMYYAGDAVGLKDGCTSLTLEDKYKFFFTGTHEELYVHNAATTKKLASVSSWTEEGIAWTVTAPTAKGLAFGPKGETGNVFWNDKNYSTDANTSDFTTWGNTDEGSIFVVELAENFVAPNSDLFYVIEAPLFEKVQGVKKAIYVNGEGNAVWGTEDLANHNFYWIPTVKADGTIALKNFGTGKYLSDATGAMSNEAVYGNLNALGSNSFNINFSGTIHANGHSSGQGANGNLIDWGGVIGSASAWTFVQKNDPTALAEVDFTYSFVYEGAEKYSQTCKTLVGEEYPAITVAFPYGVSAVKPEGEVTADMNGKKIEIELSVNLPFTFNDDSYYYIKNKGAFYLHYDAELNNIPLGNDEKSIDANNKDAYSWRFEGDPFTGFRIANKLGGVNEEALYLYAPTSVADDGTNGAEAYVVVKKQSDNTEGYHHTLFLTASTYQENGFFIAVEDHSNFRWNNRDSKLAYWTTSADNGSTFTVELRDDAAALQALVDAAEASLTAWNQTAVGYLTVSAEDKAAINEAIATAEAAIENKTGYDAAQVALEGAVAAAKTYTIQPEEGKFYTIVSSCTDDHRAGQEIYMNTYGRMQFAKVGEVADEIARVFQFVPATDGKFYIYNVENGVYMHTVGNATATTASEAKPVTITNMGSENIVKIVPDGQSMMHAQDNGSVIVGWNNDSYTNGSAWKIVETEFSLNDLTHTLTVSEAGWATLVLGYNTTIPTGVKAYAVSSIAEGKAALAEVAEVLPAHTPVLIEAEAGNYAFNYTATEATVGTNLLEGSVFNLNVSEDGYVLANGAKGVGLYKAKFNVSTDKSNDGEEGVEDDTYEAFLNNANKAYLPAPAGAEAAMFSFGRGEGTTAIDNVQLTNDNVVIYDLAGRRVEKMEKGIYIVNGKKVVK